MAPTFKYAILTAVPDHLRGERVNIGVVAFRTDGMDVRLAEVATKLRALAPGEWDGYATDMRRRLLDRFRPGATPEEMIGAGVGASVAIDPIVEVSDLAWFAARDAFEYEDRMGEILKSLVIRPKAPRRPKSTRINTEIAAELRLFRALAKPEENIETHKVVRDFLVSEEEDLVADFALKNGALHVAATLDLRKAGPRLDEAALKAITLDKAAAVFGSDVCRYGVYAAPIRRPEVNPHIALLKDYATQTFNWLDPIERIDFVATLRKAAALPFRFGN